MVATHALSPLGKAVHDLAFLLIHFFYLCLR